ncbi:hypothetical protein GCM10010435_75030 [Winogradskya consettensis]|uniref:Methyltransferase domain-containing protein n=1 Tax=Winogradskya consettensis TaxID=113560 RepID=A0A919SYE1_9ACTN|nr:hypothetical protein Aco04nite_74810 [Actinoplanes consettensis]
MIALHACDTATDDVLAFAVNHDVNYVLASPCCHHDLQQQLRPRTMPTAFRDLARGGILKEQLGDVITDALVSPRLATLLRNRLPQGLLAHGPKLAEPSNEIR